MCQALEEWYQDGINEGLSQGICRGVIETAQDFGLSKEDTIRSCLLSVISILMVSSPPIKIT